MTAPFKVTKNIRGNTIINCDFIKYNFACLLSNGTITACCYDEQGINKRGQISDISDCIYKKEYSLCQDCSGIKFYNEYQYQRKIINIVSRCPSIINIPTFKYVVKKFLL